MNLSRTDELLLYFLRDGPEGRVPVPLSDLSSAEWEDLLRKADRHGVTPMLYHRLKSIQEGALLPVDVVRKLRKSYLRSAGRNIKLYGELGKVLGKMQQENIPVIALKGAHLAEAVYGNIALRPMGDVDLLVRKEDLERAEDIFLGSGYLPSECNRQVAMDNCHFAYKSTDNGLSVEVHWALLPSIYRFEIDMGGVWDRSEPCILEGVKVSVLCQEDLLLYLCLHTSKHLFDGVGLKPIYDIYIVMRNYGENMDWKQVMFRCEQWGIAKCVYVALTLTEDIFGIDVPKDLMKAVQPADMNEGFMTYAKEQIFTCGYRTSDGLYLSPNVAQLLGTHRTRSKVAMFLKRVFPSPMEMSRWYPAPPDSLRIYSYYPARIRDLLYRYGRQAWRFVRRDEEMMILTDLEMEISPLRDWLMCSGIKRPSV